MGTVKKTKPTATIFDDGKWFELTIEPLHEQVCQVNQFAADFGRNLQLAFKLFEKVYRPHVSFDVFHHAYQEPLGNIYALRITATPDFGEVKDEIYEAVFGLIAHLVNIEDTADIELQIKRNLRNFLSRMEAVGLETDEEKVPQRYMRIAEVLAQKIQSSSFRIEINKLWDARVQPPLPVNVKDAGTEKSFEIQDELAECLQGSSSEKAPDQAAPAGGDDGQLKLGHSKVPQGPCLEPLEFELSAQYDARRNGIVLLAKLNGVGAVLKFENGCEERVLDRINKQLKGPISLLHDVNADNWSGYVVHDIVPGEDG